MNYENRTHRESGGYFCRSHRPPDTRFGNAPRFWCPKPGISARWGEIRIDQGKEFDAVNEGEAIGIVAGVPSAVRLHAPS